MKRKILSVTPRSIINSWRSRLGVAPFTCVLQIRTNNTYGITSTQVVQLPCLPILSSVTAFGYPMIGHTKKVGFWITSTIQAVEAESGENIWSNEDTTDIEHKSTEENEVKKDK